MNTERFLEYFEKLCEIPHGSGDMDKISQFCIDFAKKNGLEFYLDQSKNVIIYKKGSNGYEASEPVILQGHLDMVCQKTEDCKVDLTKRGPITYTDGDFLKAQDSTLGADNGIAVAMILAILEDKNLPAPPIEALFTTDEEIGLLGATALDKSHLSGKKMINLDSEEEDTVTVSCAGGSDFEITLPFEKVSKEGTKIILSISGLLGGHSGIEIGNNRVNANMLCGRILNHLSKDFDFDIISICGGDKSNAIPNKNEVVLCVQNAQDFIAYLIDYLDIIKEEISACEKSAEFAVNIDSTGVFEVLSCKDDLIYLLTCAPCGVQEMSAEISGLVQTSLNLGILVTKDDFITLHFALRSNKKSGLFALEERLFALCKKADCSVKTFGHYPPWEYKKDSPLRELYIETYESMYGEKLKTEAIHAGLECGVLSDGLDGLDCISIGPWLYDVHTVKEKMSISSAKRVFDAVCKTLEKLK